MAALSKNMSQKSVFKKSYGEMAKTKRTKEMPEGRQTPEY